MINFYEIIRITSLFLLAITSAYGNATNVIYPYSEEDYAVAIAFLKLQMLQDTGNDKSVVFQCKQTPLKEFAEKNKVPLQSLIEGYPDNYPIDHYAYIEVEARGFHPGDRYTIYTIDYGLAKAYVNDMVADSDGRLAFSENHSSYCLGLIDRKLMNGEQSCYVLISEDKQTYLTAAFTPYPIEYKWNDGAHLCAHIFDPDDYSFIAFGKGFQPNEKLILISESCGERISISSQADSTGIFRASLHPKLNNAKGGTGKFIVVRRTTKEKGTLNYLWGEAARKQ